MKKFIAFFVLGFVAISASAQVMTSRTYSKKTSPTTWYIRAGLSLNNLANTPDGSSLGTKAGFDGSVGFNKSIGKNGLYWGMELGAGSRGCTGDDDYSISAYNVKYSPFTFGYKYSLTDMLKLDAHVGAYASYDFSQSAKYGDRDLDEDAIFDNDVDAGIQVGIGAWYGHINLDFTYQRGFISMVKANDSMYSSNFMIRVGYAF